MVESIFVHPLQTENLEKSNANHLIVVSKGLDAEKWRSLQQLGMTLSISVNAFGSDGCPANPAACDKLLDKIDEALKYQPAEIWIDHFRFDGHWEAISDGVIPDIHPACDWCKDKKRVTVLEQIAKLVMKHVDGRTRIGYFAVPFKTQEVPLLVEGLGQEHSVIGKIFDLSSPMLYHRMIRKPISYISEYVDWIAQQTSHPVLPIIQIKDMPDHLPDLMTEQDIREAFDQAKQPPSTGVAIFWWVHALEKNKTGIIARLFAAE